MLLDEFENILPADKHLSRAKRRAGDVGNGKDALERVCAFLLEQIHRVGKVDAPAGVHSVVKRQLPGQSQTLRAIGDQPEFHLAAFPRPQDVDVLTGSFRDAVGFSISDGQLHILSYVQALVGDDDALAHPAGKPGALRQQGSMQVRPAL